MDWAPPAPTAVDAAASLPTQFALGQNFPNPFNPTTTIRYDVPADRGGESVSLAVYDLAGQRVRQLALPAPGAGTHYVTWDGLDESGHAVASGVYLCRLQAGSLQFTRRMTLSR